MTNNTIKLIEGILNGALRRGQSVLLHELLWTVDAQLHLIVTAEEINEALQRVPPVRIHRRGGCVELVPDASQIEVGITATDIDSAAALYTNQVSEIIAKLSGKKSK